MPRSYSRDIPMQRLPVPEDGAVRSYVSRRGAAFMISVFSKRGHDEENAWKLTHQPSGGHARLWSYRECIALARKLMSAPRYESERFVILGRGDFEGQVLFDRASGQWWKRGFMQPVTREQMTIMSELRPIEAVREFQAFQLSLEDQQHEHYPQQALNASANAKAKTDVNVDDADVPARRGRPRLTMEERVARWQAAHVPRPHARHGQRRRR